MKGFLKRLFLGPRSEAKNSPPRPRPIAMPGDPPIRGRDIGLYMDYGSLMREFRVHLERIEKALYDAGYSTFPRAEWEMLTMRNHVTHIKVDVFWDLAREIKYRIDNGLPCPTFLDRER